MPSDDEMAATAPAGPDDDRSPLRRPAQPGRAMFGRYRIEATLGEGGMGVVHAAFDPELERKVALKVLRDTGSADGRARLLREARAMAKLSHPHVITVFDVGSEAGEDFVAMELIDGETLGEWLRAHHPRPRQILAAFVAAGRGLAAAHCAGLVHRDFKPSNVLRSRDGKIVVTDFGLARDAGAADGAPLQTGSSGSAEQTRTGALLGTPAYMAPEQWTGGEVTPATDQFAFCVALWEALAGERPYSGTTLEELRSGVLGGPAALAADAIPRPLRAILRRGLATQAADRWPTMDALLGALERYLGRRTRWLAGGAGVVGFAAIAAVYGFARSGATGDGCPPPLVDPDAVPVAALAARDAGAGELVRGDLARWRELRSRACGAPAAERLPRLACFDAVLDRLDATVRSASADRSVIDADLVSRSLVDPAMCALPSPPRMARMTPELVAAFAASRHARSGVLTPDELALGDRATSACARIVALKARTERFDARELSAHSQDVVRDAGTLGELLPRCDDDDLKTEVLLFQAYLKPPLDLAAAEAAVAAFPQDDLKATVEDMRADAAMASEKWEEAAAGYERALELHGRRRQLRAQILNVVSATRALLARGTAADVARVQALNARWVPLARPLGPRSSRLEFEAERLRWALGDIAGADAALEAMRGQGRLTDFTPLYPQSPAVDIAGDVVDETGAPVAHARVVAAEALIDDAVTVGTLAHTQLMRATETGADGRFTLSGARGVVMAQAGARRSLREAVAPQVHLVVRATGTIAGRVALGRFTANRAAVIVIGGRKAAPIYMIAPIRPDGTFEVAGVPRGRIVLGVTTTANYIPAGKIARVVLDGDRLDGVELSTSGQRLYVIAHTADVTAPEGAVVWICKDFDPGAHPTPRALKGHDPLVQFGQRIDPKNAPPELAGSLQPDDVVTTISDRPEGKLLVCGTGIAIQQFASVKSPVEFGERVAELETSCVHVAADQLIATIDLQPIRKLTQPQRKDADKPAPAPKP